MRLSILDQSVSLAGSTEDAGFTDEEMTRVVTPMRAPRLRGHGSEVADKLYALSKELLLDEIVVNTWAHAPGVRHKSYTLLAQAFGLAKIGR